MIGNVVLAGHMRAERTSIARTLLSNRGYVIWAAAVILTVVVGLGWPLLQERLHLEPLPAASVWLVAIAAAVILPSWWELWKWWQRGRASGREAEPSALDVRPR